VQGLLVWVLVLRCWALGAEPGWCGGFGGYLSTAKDLMLAETVLRSSETSFNMMRISSILSTSWFSFLYQRSLTTAH
jgi:hypothetical protein